MSQSFYYRYSFAARRLLHATPRIHSNRRPNSQHGRRRASLLQNSPLRAIKAGPVDVDVVIADRIDLPDRMPHFIAKRSTPASSTETPLMFLEEMLNAIGGR